MHAVFCMQMFLHSMGETGRDRIVASLSEGKTVRFGKLSTDGSLWNKGKHRDGGWISKTSQTIEQVSFCQIKDLATEGLVSFLISCLAHVCLRRYS